MFLFHSTRIINILTYNWEIGERIDQKLSKRFYIRWLEARREWFDRARYDLGSCSLEAPVSSDSDILKMSGFDQRPIICVTKKIFETGKDQCLEKKSLGPAHPKNHVVLFGMFLCIFTFSCSCFWLSVLKADSCSSYISNFSGMVIVFISTCSKFNYWLSDVYVHILSLKIWRGYWRRSSLPSVIVFRWFDLTCKQHILNRFQLQSTLPKLNPWIEIEEKTSTSKENLDLNGVKILR